jgi:YHS domain-containing protein
MASKGTAIDPVCGCPVAETSAETSEYRSRRYYFCSRRCRRRFEDHSEQMHAAELARLGVLFGRPGARWGLA